MYLPQSPIPGLEPQMIRDSPLVLLASGSRRDLAKGTNEWAPQVGPRIQNCDKVLDSWGSNLGPAIALQGVLDRQAGRQTQRVWDRSVPFRLNAPVDLETSEVQSPFCPEQPSPWSRPSKGNARWEGGSNGSFRHIVSFYDWKGKKKKKSTEHRADVAESKSNNLSGRNQDGRFLYLYCWKENELAVNMCAHFWNL